MDMNISLNQGIKFKKYQKRIRPNIDNIDPLFTPKIPSVNKSIQSKNMNKKGTNTKGTNTKSINTKSINAKEPQSFLSSLFSSLNIFEGFDNILEKNQQEQQLVVQENASDLSQMQNVDNEYDGLLSQYQNLEKTEADSTKSMLDRYSSKNPYLGQNLRFDSNGSTGYVTNLAQYKWYPTTDIIDNTSNKNGCPSINKIFNIAGVDNTNTPGSIIQTTPSLVVGSTMISGQSCGNEGQNVYVNSLSNNVNTNYIGCYFNSSQDDATTNSSAMTSTDQVLSFQDCETYAVNSGNPYFALQNTQSNNTGNCMVGNNLTDIQQYGDGSKKIVTKPIWASNTSGTSLTMTVTNSGQISITDSSNATIVSFPSSPVNNCINNGTIGVNTATYGGNCQVPIGNVTTAVIDKYNCNSSKSCSIPVSNASFGDPAGGCAKSFDIAYTCGGTAASQHLDYAEGQTFILDCNDYINKNCTFFLILQNDGNMCIYRGSPDNIIQPAVWVSSTNGQQQEPNSTWIASQGKFGLPYLTSGNSLSAGEWIGSADGALKLMMQEDGNLVLYTSMSTPGCISDNSGKMYGTQNINAVYELSNLGNPLSMGKVAYIDGDTNRREYPSSMLGLSNEYDIYNGFDSAGNNLSNLNASNINDCQTACTNSSDCYGFVWQPEQNLCYLKDKNTYPSSSRQQNNKLTLGVRKPSVINNDPSCPTPLFSIDTIQYDNYPQGDAMSSSTSCSVPLQNKELTELQKKVDAKAKQVASYSNNLINNNVSINNEMTSGAAQMKTDVKNYFNTKGDTAKLLGQETVESMLNMNDLNAMITDSDLYVLQENSQYFFWSILALGIITVTLNVKK